MFDSVFRVGVNHALDPPVTAICRDFEIQRRIDS